MTSTASDTLPKRPLPDWAHRVIAGAVLLAITAALGGFVWKQRVVAPLDGQRLSVVQGVAVFEALPAGWKAVHLGGFDYVAVRKDEPLDAAAGARIGAVIAAQAAKSLHDAKTTEGAQYVPSAQTNALQAASGHKVAIVYYGVGEVTKPMWNVYFNAGTITDHDDEFTTQAEALADAKSLAAKGYSVVDATQGVAGR